MSFASAGEAGRTLLETLLVAALVAVLLVVAADRFLASEKTLKETALTMELANLRGAVVHHAAIERRLPASLKELAETNMQIPKKELSGEYSVMVVGRYVEGASVDSEGWPLDPFGNRYGYDPDRGRVWSTTPGYEAW